jgi:hypothetical protein
MSSAESAVIKRRAHDREAGMRDLALRSLLHGAALGNEGDGATAAMLAAEIDMSR